MSIPSNFRSSTPGRGFAWLGLGAAALLAACAGPRVSLDVPIEPVAPPPVAYVPPPLPVPSLVSEALTPRDYRRDGARHLYGKNTRRIFKGKMPPLLQGVGTMQLQLDGRGEILAMDWMRPPSHAGAKAEIERTVREAAPYPAPVRMGQVVYTDTWLWDKSGNFQLDTLTEGQSSK